MQFTVERSFVWAEHKRNNFAAWRPEDAPDFDPGNGFIVAHDIMEHFTKDTAFPCELLAFGTTLWGRMLVEPRNIEMSAKDLAGFLGTKKDVKVPDRHWLLPLKDTKAEARLQTFLAVALEVMVLDMFIMPTLTIQRSPKEARFLLDTAAGWIRLGYRLAERRYAGHTPEDMVLAQIALSDAVNDDHNDQPPEFGDRLTVTFDPKDLSFNLKRSRVLEAA